MQHPEKMANLEIERYLNYLAVLSANEVAAILNHFTGKYWLITALLYGCGFRIKEVLMLRIKDVDIAARSTKHT